MAAFPGKVSRQTEASGVEKVKPWVARICGACPMGNYFIFTKSILFIWGLVLAHIIVEYAIVSTMMIYLLNVIGQHLLIAAITINVFDGLSAILVFILACISYAYTAWLNAIVFSTGAYIMGLYLLWIISCSPEEPGICNVALLLMAIGKSGRSSALRSYFECQLRKENGCTETAGEHQTTADRRREQQREIGVKIWWYSAWISGYVIAVFAIGGSTPQESTKISALLMLAMFLIFYFGICCYYLDNPNRKSLSGVFKVLKATSRKLYLWATFIPYGLVLATGYTLFIAQIANMNILIGSNFTVTVPISFFFVLKSFVSNIVVFLFWLGGTERKSITVIRIGAGMMCAVLCCVVAWQVELQRLHIIKKEALMEYPTVMSSMSVLWLIPQYTLLGLMEGLAGDGLVTHICGHVPRLVRSFGEPFSELMWCTGKFCSIFFVLFCNSWFGQSINFSHLDRYFLVLAIISFLFFCFYLFWWRNYENPEINGDIQQPELVSSQATQGTIENTLLNDEADKEEEGLETAEGIIKGLQSAMYAAKDKDEEKDEDQNTAADRLDDK